MVHKVVEPDLKVTVPVAAALMPDSAKVAWAPKVMVAEVEPLTVVEKTVGGSRSGPTVLVPAAPGEVAAGKSTKVAVMVGIGASSQKRVVEVTG